MKPAIPGATLWPWEQPAFSLSSSHLESQGDEDQQVQGGSPGQGHCPALPCTTAAICFLVPDEQQGPSFTCLSLSRGRRHPLCYLKWNVWLIGTACLIWLLVLGVIRESNKNALNTRNYIKTTQSLQCKPKKAGGLSMETAIPSFIHLLPPKHGVLLWRRGEPSGHHSSGKCQVCLQVCLLPPVPG